MRSVRVAAAAAIATAAMTAACGGGGQPPVNGVQGTGAMSSVANSAPLTGSVITFNPASPLYVGLNQSVTVSVGESGYTGGFTVAGCSAKLPVRCTWIKYGQACYQNYTPDQLNSIEAKIYPGARTMTVANGAVGTYFPKIVCHFKIKDTRGIVAWYTAWSP